MIKPDAEHYLRSTMPSHATQHQRDLMRSFYELHDGDHPATCAAYVRAEADGRAFRKRGSLRMSSEDYAKGLLADGLKKGWISAIETAGENDPPERIAASE